MNNPGDGQTGPSRLAIIGPMMEAPPVAARVLIIEDDPNVAEVVGRYLTREGYDVEIATDGVSGLDRALSDPPELVVLDLMLPKLGGLEVCKRIRAAAGSAGGRGESDVTARTGSRRPTPCRRSGAPTGRSRSSPGAGGCAR